MNMNKLIRLVLRLLPLELVSEINEESLKVLHENGWVIFEDEVFQNEVN